MATRIGDSYLIQRTDDDRWGVWRRKIGHLGRRSLVGYGATRKEADKIKTEDQLRRSRKVGLVRK